MSAIIKTLILAVTISELVIDELLTKTGLKLGCGETNPFFNFLKKRMKERYAHAFLTIAGSMMMLCLYLRYDGNGTILMYFTVALNAPIVVNSVVLLRKVSKPPLAVPHYPSIAKPKEA
jgi:hypothetical protein